MLVLGPFHSGGWECLEGTPPSRRYTPVKYTPWEGTPKEGNHLWKVNPLEGTPPGRYTILWKVHPCKITPSPGKVHPRKVHPQKLHPLVMTSSGGHRSGRYTSYRNAFLFHILIENSSLKLKIPMNSSCSATIKTAQKYLLHWQ